ncbi:MAG: phage holin family protein [Cyanobacteria bacterium P01_G01_bin.4]
MTTVLLTWLATALSLLVVDIVVPGVDIDTLTASILAAIIIGFINSSIKPVLKTLSMPVNVLSFGLFALIVNGFCFWLASAFVPNFYVSGIIAFLLGPVVLSAVNTFIENYFSEKFPDSVKSEDA